MHPYVLEFFVKIIGVSAASGLFYHNGKIKVISDHSNYLYSYTITTNTLTKTLLYDNANTNDVVAKKEKLDLESIFQFQNNFYLLGSGSEKNRQNLFIVNPQNEVLQEDLSEEYAIAREVLGISKEDFNIEGAFVYNDKYYLLNRGNGPNRKNGIIIADRSLQVTPEFVPIDLSHISPYLSFTDGIVVDNYIYFLSAIEETTSTYADGQIGGSYLGCIDLETLTLETLIPISDKHKFEGITLYKNDSKSLEFLLCEDSDNEIQETMIYKLKLEK